MIDSVKRRAFEIERLANLDDEHRQNILLVEIAMATIERELRGDVTGGNAQQREDALAEALAGHDVYQRLAERVRELKRYRAKTASEMERERYIIRAELALMRERADPDLLLHPAMTDAPAM